MGDCNCRHGGTTSTGLCVECDIEQLARNNYFTGKLLVQRDFTDEQRYFLGKLRRHNQKLHGWGAVCGLKVRQHPNPACQDHFVVIEPGYAVDCCGREIVVAREEFFDFKDQFLANWQAQHGPTTTPDSSPRTIQICVSYKECAAEDVPALFDDCSASAGACQPNRIVDGYSFDVLIDPPPSSPDVDAIKVAWANTVNVAGAVRVAVNDASQRLYVLARTSNGSALYAVDTTNFSVTGSQAFDQISPLDVAVSSLGDFVYAVFQPASGDPQILVLPPDLSKPVSTLTFKGGAGSPVRLAVAPAPDNRLLATSPAAGAYIWATDVTAKANPAKPKQITGVGDKPSAIAVGDDAKSAYIVDTASGNLSAVPLSSLQPTTVSLLVGAVSAEIAVVTTSAGDRLAVLDATSQKLYLISMQSGSPVALSDPVQGFAHPASTVQMAPGGRWVYLVEQDAASQKAYVEEVDAHAVELKLPQVFGGAVAVGVAPVGDAALSQDGSHLYVPYGGDGNVIPGAVAVVDITENDCPDIFKEAIEKCPDCSSGNCTVLATISNYVYGRPVIDSVIDNLKDRRLLVSTDLLTEVVRCILDQGPGSGKPGPQGVPGPAGLPGTNGNDGAGIAAVTANFVTCDQKGSASLSGVAPNLTLNLTIPGTCNPDLAKINFISWIHGKPNPTFMRIPLVIGFSDEVQSEFLTADTVVLLLGFLEGDTTGKVLELISWDEFRGVVVEPGNITNKDPNTFKPVTAPAAANAVRIDTPTLASLRIPNLTGKARVIVKGDFIPDFKNGRGLDADHLPLWLPKRETGDGIEGGTFESWFTFSQG